MKTRLAIGVGLVLLVVAAWVAYRVWFTPLRGEPREEGEVAPAFALGDQNGQQVTLESLLADGPAVIVFYRGQW